MNPDELTGPRLLELAAAKPLTQQSALILGNGALDLQEELVAGIVGDGVPARRNSSRSSAW
jgi:hypothetical protein